MQQNLLLNLFFYLKFYKIIIFTIIIPLVFTKIINECNLCNKSPSTKLINSPINNNKNDLIISNKICRQPKDRGITCENKKMINESEIQIKWYFDEETLQCLAFGYKGCGGNDNKFSSIFECKQKCPLPMDYGGCSGHKPSAINSKGQQIFCSGHPNMVIENCPKGYRCQGMAFFSICCEIKNEEIYHKNFNPKCANGKQLYQINDEINKWKINYLGKSCNDKFCPLNSDCVQLEIFSHCCF